ncbi:MAG: hypothetical protein H8M99_12340 [Gloeobacteraceae cyanobacterium ES-bin-144]|nr:hypothetical protein [Verrucomicrobiales bacterium]
MNRLVQFKSFVFGFALMLGDAFAQNSEETKLLFGTSEKDASGLIAIIYDLKQTQTMKPSYVTPERYPDVVEEFLKSGWNETILNRYFRITRPLYSSNIFIPRIDATAAPKAYGVEKVMKPSCWVIHYKGQVSPPEDGIYRFVGYADDILAVAVNNKTVCLGHRPDMSMDSVWKSKEKPGALAYNGNLVYGDWVTLKKDQPIDLDILVGERPGGFFCAFLLFQKQGDTYQNDKEGHPILPVFQLSNQNIQSKSGINGPRCSKGGIWRQYR